MKIFMVGNFTYPWCSEVHWAESLEKLGHEVTRRQENEIRPGMIDGGVIGHDLFLWVRTWEGFVRQQDLDAVRARGIPSVNIHLDLFVGISREATLDNDPRWRTDYVFTADGDPKSQEIFEEHGINHFWLRPGVVEDGCKMFEPNSDPSLQGDIVFVGGGKQYAHREWPYRKQLIEFLENTYPDKYKKYGHPERLVREADLNQLYANAKIVIGDSLNVGFNHQNYWSDRVYETVGRGGFIIHPFIEGLQNDFELSCDGRDGCLDPDVTEIVTYKYRDFKDLKFLIDYYLENESEREKIRKNGFQRVKKEHTYTHRMKEMLDVVFGKNPAEILGGNGKINLGAGTDIQEGYVNVDMVDLEGIDVVHNLMRYPWPFEDNSASEIRAVDVLEHLPPYIGEEHGVIKFINECWRILEHGGELFIQTPGWRAEFLWIDPTHVRGFDIQSMDFFDPEKPFGKSTGFYSPYKFSVRAEELENHNLRFWMKKV